ncbi:MAG: hypothetical protein U9R74_14825 [Pseudomonadota bacterium]|nr:hypothetical protein [Pseudomonadota bacterium]
MNTKAYETITATELVRNLSAAIDRVRIGGHGLRITKGSRTVAELRPPPKPGLPIGKLAELLESLPEVGDDAGAMARDLESIRRNARLPEDPWG